MTCPRPHYVAKLVEIFASVVRGSPLTRIMTELSSGTSLLFMSTQAPDAFEAGARSGSPCRRISSASFAVVTEHQRDSSFFKNSRLALGDSAPESFTDVIRCAFPVAKQASRPKKV
mgnify:CR=1 FL=1